jgi:hypothetical protein
MSPSAQTEMPEDALVVGQRRIHRGIIQKYHALLRVTGIVLGHPIRQSQRDAGAIALRDVADTLVDCLPENQQRFLRIGLAVEGHDLELHSTEHAAACIHGFRRDLVVAQSDLADVGERSAEAFDEGDLDGVLRRRHSRQRRHHHPHEQGQHVPGFHC